MRTGVTAQADKAMGQDAALQVGVKFVNDIIGQACGDGIGRDGGQKGFEMVGDDLVENCATGVSRLVRGGHHILARTRHTAGIVTCVTTTTHMCTISKIYFHVYSPYFLPEFFLLLSLFPVFLWRVKGENRRLIHIKNRERRDRTGCCRAEK